MARIINPAATTATSTAAARSRNARGEGDKLRTEIVEAMLRLLADDERMRPVPLSLREVAREAGITAPAIYRHFAGKDDLTRAALDILFEQLLAAMDRADAEAAGQEPSVRLAALAHAYCLFAQENPPSFRIMFNAAPDLSGDGTARISERWRTSIARLAETNARVARAPETAATWVWSAVHGRLMLDLSSAGALGPLGDMHTFIDDLTHDLKDVS
ncbi:TetR/AcrR family transcriptional regulator [Streptomyces sp. NPDC088725]|uniref:TetR/AcrR family transcriptional regulator n=1 Tax=Streptomyces sp. NPDC088725 TaxID=3365873 RepID=UPI0038146378